jgi:hypothetical protein
MAYCVCTYTLGRNYAQQYVVDCTVLPCRGMHDVMVSYPATVPRTLDNLLKRGSIDVRGDQPLCSRVQFAVGG